MKVETNEVNEQPLRDKIARLVVYLSLGVMLLLGGLGAYLIHSLDTNKEINQARFDTMQFIFASLVPVVGTWMGTVMAFYFSKENLEAANRSVNNLINHITTSNEKLASIKSVQVMIKLKDIIHYTVPQNTDLGSVKISELLVFMHERNVTRLPVLDENKIVRFMFHKSVLDGFIADKALSGEPINPPAPLANLTLKDFSESKHPRIQKILQNAFMFVNVDSNLCEAQEKIDKTDVCQDVFVTPKGLSTEPIVGWITNITIAENAKV
jgi:hypothetical protein